MGEIRLSDRPHILLRHIPHGGTEKKIDGQCDMPDRECWGDIVGQSFKLSLIGAGAREYAGEKGADSSPLLLLLLNVKDPFYHSPMGT
jgi:hypothetical protein